ncbi:MAG: hypothetical protein AB8B87_19245 [Granulosicoccus sp.]
MKAQKNNELATLSDEEIQCVGGSGKLPGRELRAQDMYGNTLSVEEYMDLQLAIAKGEHRGGHTSLSDFYSPGYNGKMPNIYG